MQWTARFIAPRVLSRAAPIFRTEAALVAGHGSVTRAALFSSAHGICDTAINGRPTSPDLLVPGWTSYEWRTRYAEHDVTDLISGPRVAIGITVGNGWYCGRLAWEGGSGYYGDRLAAIAELRIRFEDGFEQIIATDDSWRTSSGSTTFDDLYDGQRIDARLEQAGWTRPGFDDSAWDPVDVVAGDLEKLEEQRSPAVRRTGEVRAQSISRRDGGGFLIDFGQNLVGWTRVVVSGPRGDVIRVQHAEVLEGDELGIRPLRSARATDEFTLSGGADVFEPTMTFHGFRYVEVTGWPTVEPPSPDQIVAIVVGTDLRRTGTFASSNPLLNQLHENVVWGMRGNFLSIPTDCPQRDERLGWTGDIAVFAPTAGYLFDSADFLRDWLRDVRLEQAHHGGIVPMVVPDVLKYVTPASVPPLETTAIWSDVVVWVPWALWMAYGDRAVLEECFESMVGHVRHVGSLLSPTGVWDQGFQYGDWLDPDAPPDRPGEAKADPGVVATAAAYRSADLLARICRVLGKEDELAEFGELAERIRNGFLAQYVDASRRRIRSDCPTVYALAIAFGPLPAEHRPWAGDRLADLVAAGGYRIATGFAGTPYILDALSSTGHASTAGRLLLETSNPSWLYPVTMGATTIWERWDSMLPDGSINPGEMTSFNHYALGAVADWMHRVLGGLGAAEPGYTRLTIDPTPIVGVDWVDVALETARGLVSVRWERHVDGLHVKVVIPPGVSAIVRDGGTDVAEVSGGVHEFTLTARSLRM